MSDNAEALDFEEYLRNKDTENKPKKNGAVNRSGNMSRGILIPAKMNAQLEEIKSKLDNMPHLEPGERTMGRLLTTCLSIALDNTHEFIINRLVQEAEMRAEEAGKEKNINTAMRAISRMTPEEKALLLAQLSEEN